MDKILKKIIVIIGIALLLVVEILNVVFISNLSILEITDVQINSILKICIVLFLVVDIYIINMLLKRITIKIKKKTLILGIIIVLYVIGQIAWINCRQAKPIADQLTVYEMARGMVEGNLDKVIEEGKTYSATLENSTYLQSYPQQFTLSFIWSILFRIFGSTSLSVIQYFNAICNGITVLAIYLITVELSKKYKVNKYLAMSLIITFITLPLLSTFIYGDLSSLAFALLSIYFIMKYTDKEKIRYALLSAMFMMIAYMLRMNILIFIIATIIYLFMDLISKKTSAKSLAIKIIVLMSFAIIVMTPSIIVKNYYCNKYNLDKNKKFPTTGYLYMGMEEATAGYGWFNHEYVQYAFQDAEKANEIYKERIGKRISFLARNPAYTVSFYTKKTASMWAENTYSSIYYNYYRNFIEKDSGGIYEDVRVPIDLNLILGKFEVRVQKLGNILKIYQKALILIIFGCSIIVLIQNEKNISNEVILLITIFIGGFLFHTMWEAKSRYIIPYIVALIPIASIELNKIKIKGKKNE